MKKLLSLLIICSLIFSSAVAQPINSVLLIKKATSGGSAYETETTTYLNALATAGASLTSAQKDSVNRFFKDLKGLSNPRYTTFNVLSRIIALYPYLGGSAATCAINAVNPGTYDLTHTGSPTFSSTGCVYNGSSQYSNTNYTPANIGSYSATDMTGWGVHRRDANDDGNATLGVASSGNSYGIIRSDNFRAMFGASNSLVSGAGTLGVNAYWAVSWSTTSTGNAYRNGVNIKTNTGLSFGTVGSLSPYIGAFHSGSGAGYGGAVTIDFFILPKDLWSDAEQTFMYNAVTALNSSFGR